MGLLHFFARIFGIIRKELTELRRQPGLLLILVVGPLSVLLVFGAGIRTQDPAVRTIFVAPQSSDEVYNLVKDYAKSQSKRLTIVDVSRDEADSMAALQDGRANMVIIVPGDPMGKIAKGKRSTIQVFHTFLDPLEQQALLLFARGAVDDLNDIYLSRLIAQTQDQGRDLMTVADGWKSLGQIAGVITNSGELKAYDLARNELKRFTDINPKLIATPLRQETQSIAGKISAGIFYAPAVLALIIQHLTLTFIAVSIVREQELGTTELFAVSPLTPWERHTAKIWAYVISGATISTILVAGLHFGLGVPIRGGVTSIAIIMLLEILASIGWGLMLASVCKNITQVVQGSMLFLLASVFFGGLVLNESRFADWLQPITWILPMRNALHLLRDSMLQGFPLAQGPTIALAASALVLITAGMLIAWRRERL